MNFSVVSVIGLGHIGLPTVALLASHKKKVIGVDVNPEVVDAINLGKAPVVEPGLDILLRTAVTDGYLRATTQVEPADAFLIAVPTPLAAGRTADTSHIQQVSRSIAPVLKKGDLVILESTSPVGTTKKMVNWLANFRPDLSFPQSCGAESDIRVAYCPERVLPGHIIQELVTNERVIGGMTSKCSEIAVDFYQMYVEGKCVVTTVHTAEMVKLVENSFRDLNIAFANELSMISDKLDINVWELIRLANRHPRVNILRPGPGVGGHCIAVDPWFIVSHFPDEAPLIRTAREVNESKTAWVLSKVELAVADFLKQHPSRKAKELTIAFFGLTYKPDIDDLRESPALRIATELRARHSGKVLIVEPNISTLAGGKLRGCELVDLNTAIAEADIQVLLVAHREFKAQWRTSKGKSFVIDAVGISENEDRHS